MRIIAFTAIYSCRSDAYPAPTLSVSLLRSPSSAAAQFFIFYFFKEKSGPHAPEEHKVL